MSYRSRLRIQRRRVFLGCEGESERSYGALLAQLLETRRQDIHLEVVLMRPGGGDPLTLVERAAEYVKRSKRRFDAPFQVLGLLLDKDLLNKDRHRDDKAFKIASSIDLRLIWQDPCHEALLLRHLDGYRDVRPSSPQTAISRLEKHWPEYEKGISKYRLAEKLRIEDVLRAAEVELELAAFLKDIGFL